MISNFLQLLERALPLVSATNAEFKYGCPPVSTTELSRKMCKSAASNMQLLYELVFELRQVR